MTPAKYIPPQSLTLGIEPRIPHTAAEAFGLETRLAWTPTARLVAHVFAVLSPAQQEQILLSMGWTKEKP